jgi:hypothetical protein
MLAGLVLAMAVGADPTVALGSGPRMCAALTAADFTAVGLQPDATPPRPPNSTEPTGAYCTYTKALPIAGGLELDVFDGESDPAGVVKTILAESGKPTAAGLAGVDESVLTLTPGEKGVTMASLVVRHRRLVFAITIPSSPKAKAQLLSLGATVLARVKH